MRKDIRLEDDLRLLRKELCELETSPKDEDVRFRFCRAVRRAKLRCEDVMRLRNRDCAVERLLGMAGRAADCLRHAKASSFVVASIRRHVEEVEKAAARWAGAAAS